MEFNNVLCATPSEFSEEVKKWQNKGAAPIIRGRKLYAYGEVVAELVNNHGGKREGAGRPTTDRNVCITFRTTKEAADKLNKLTDNKSMYLTELILKQKS